MSLAIYSLQLYEEEFDMKTWKFLKSRLKEIQTWDQIDAVSTFIIGKILLKYPKLEKELLKLSKNENFWMRRIAIVSTLPRIKTGDIKLTMKLAEDYITLNRKEGSVLESLYGDESGSNVLKDL